MKIQIAAFDYITYTVRKRTVPFVLIAPPIDFQPFTVLAWHCIIIVRTDAGFS
jgi:hypothetical protein